MFDQSFDLFWENRVYVVYRNWLPVVLLKGDCFVIGSVFSRLNKLFLCSKICLLGEFYDVK